MNKLLIALALLCGSLRAQPSCIQLTATLYSMGPSGNQLMTGYIELNLGYFTSNGGFTITQSLTTLNITAKVNNLSTCPPPSTIIQAKYTVTTGGRTPVHYMTYWYIPNTGGPYALTSVPSGHVNVSGNPGVVTWLNGLDFTTAQINDTPTINGLSNASIASKQGIAQMTLYSNIGTLVNVTYSDGPIERTPASLTGVNPPSIFGLPGPIGPQGPSGTSGGIQWYGPVTFTDATTVSVLATQFNTDANVIVICQGVAECGSVNVAPNGDITVGFLTATTGSLMLATGTPYVATFASASTVSIPFTSLQAQIALLGCYDTGGYQFGAGNLNTPAFDSGIGGGQGVNYLLDLGTPNQSGRCVFLQGAQQ